MNILIDWLSISLPYSNVFSFQSDGTIVRSTGELDSRLRKLARFMLQHNDLEQRSGRAPFKHSLHSPAGGFTYFYGGGYDYSLLEITGTGCQKIREGGGFQNLLVDWEDRFTRIDIAVDIETDLSPAIFARERDLNRFKSGADMISETGHTVYVGSRKSDRYARVYRYYPPHPRSNLLRVEMVAKGASAQLIARSIASDGVVETAAQYGTVFAWHHETWKIEPEQAEFSLSVPRESHEGSTERWLLTQVLPAIKKLIDEGKTDTLRYFLEQVSIYLTSGKKGD